MVIQTPVVGIPNWDWKKDLVEKSERKPNTHLLPINDFCYECSRHKDILVFFDGNGILETNEYYLYQKKIGRNSSAIRGRIKKFRSLYKDIQRNGCQVPPTVTVDGCRLNGSHRIAILNYLGVQQSNINVVRYEDHYSDKKSRKIREQVRKYRQEVYNL